MREILFRGKGTSDCGLNAGDWIYGYYVKDIWNINDCGIIPSDRNKGGYCEVLPETVGQYTGLTDKNGNKIFEGDIVEADDYIFVVKFGKCGGVANAENYGFMGFYFDGFDKITKDCIRYGLRNDICYFTDLEVIGNMHDNPELLKGGAE